MSWSNFLRFVLFLNVPDVLIPLTCKIVFKISCESRSIKLSNVNNGYQSTLRNVLDTFDLCSFLTICRFNLFLQRRPIEQIPIFSISSESIWLLTNKIALTNE